MYAKRNYCEVCGNTACRVESCLEVGNARTLVNTTDSDEDKGYEQAQNTVGTQLCNIGASCPLGLNPKYIRHSKLRKLLKEQLAEKQHQSNGDDYKRHRSRGPPWALPQGRRYKAITAVHHHPWLLISYAGRSVLLCLAETLHLPFESLLFEQIRNGAQFSLERRAGSGLLDRPYPDRRSFFSEKAAEFTCPVTVVEMRSKSGRRPNLKHDTPLEFPKTHVRQALSWHRHATARPRLLCFNQTS